MRVTYLPDAAQKVQQYKNGDVRLWKSMKDVLKAIGAEQPWTKRSPLDPELVGLPYKSWGLAVNMPDERAQLYVCWRTIKHGDETVAEIVYIGKLPL